VPGTLIRGVDASFDPLTQAEANCLAASSFTLFVQCLWTAARRPLHTIQSLHNAVAAGLPIAGYISLNQFQSGAWHVSKGRAGIPQELWDKMHFVAIDVELENIRVEAILEACRNVEALGRRAVVYTNWQSWMNYVKPSNPPDLAAAGYLLWNAYWDQHPDIDFPSAPFGNWKLEQVIGEQWSGGSYVCGQHVDRNSFIKELLFPDTAEEEPMTPEERKAFDLLKTRVDWLAVHTKVCDDRHVKVIDRINAIVCTVIEIESSITQHFNTHNSGGGTLERNAMPTLIRLSEQVEELIRQREGTLDELNELRSILAEEEGGD
jgi:hypothetical protein